jgi:hypothetical protein
MKLVKIAVPVILSLSIGGLPARAQSEFENQVRTYLDAGKVFAESQGWELTVGPVTGAMEEGGSRTHTLAMVRGVDYLIVGVCDNDCSDVDVKLYDPQGKLVQQDVLVDDAPVVEHRTAVTKRHRIEVIMASCSFAPCHYGINVYAK